MGGSRRHPGGVRAERRRVRGWFQRGLRGPSVKVQASRCVHSRRAGLPVPCRHGRPVSAVTVDREGRVWWITLNRPEKRNALNEEVRRGLTAAFDELGESPEIGVVVLRGTGKAFSAGADLDEASTGSGRDRPWAVRRHRSGSWQRTLDRLEALPQTTVASLHGHCIGGAALLAVSCDLRIGDPSLKVRIPEVALGIPLTWAGVPRLVREVGLPLTRDLVMTGRVLDAEAALACGYLQRLAPPEGLARLTAGLVEELLAMPPGPLAMTKALTAALGREQTLVGSWADADLLAWSLREADSRAAAAGYRKSRGTEAPGTPGPSA